MRAKRAMQVRLEKNVNVRQCVQFSAFIMIPVVGR
jgi:hypothetical protein